MAQQDSSDRVQQGLKREYSEDKSKCLVTFWLAKEAAPEARCIALEGSRPGSPLHCIRRNL